MQIRLVNVKMRKSGTRAEKAELVDVDVVTIGRGTDRTISLSGLSVALEHAEIHHRGGHSYVKPVGNEEVRVDGHIVSPGAEQRVGVGDVIRIGHHEIRPVAPREGEVLCLEIEEVVQRGTELAELQARTSLRLEDRLPSKRVLSWAAVIAIVGLFLAVPLLTGVLSRAGTEGVGSGQGVLERSWNSGTISSAHSFFAAECGTCHVSGFSRVPDSSCTGCHPIGAHAAAENLPASHAEDLAETRCASCHVEHNGRAGLAALEQKLCSDCHANLSDEHPETQFANASDFLRNHPQFRLAVFEPASGESPQTEWSEDLVERSGVKFPHLQHVGRPVGIYPPRPESEGGMPPQHLACNACHETDAGGRYMKPVNFEEHCQDCHALTFDPVDHPDRQALHGEPSLVRADLVEFYAGHELSKELGLPPPGAAPQAKEQPRFQRRRGILAITQERRLTKQQRDRMIGTAREKAAKANALLMVERPDARNQEHCVSCHVMQDGTAEDGGIGVQPVHVADVWMPSFDFGHDAHAPFPCRDCHAGTAVYDEEHEKTRALAARDGRPEWSTCAAPGDASARTREGCKSPYALWTPAELAKLGFEPSESSADINLPRLESCRDCHAGARAPVNMVASDCVLCHPFHRDPEERGLMRAQSGESAAKLRTHPGFARAPAHPVGAGR